MPEPCLGCGEHNDKKPPPNRAAISRTAMRKILARFPLAPILAAFFATFPLAAQAQDIAELYQAKAIVTGTGEENRQIGFRLCLRDVLVRVSGDQRVVRNPAFKPLLKEAGSFVAEFRYRDRLEGIPVHDEQGTHDRPHDLTCIYKPETVDALLASLGSKPWLAVRPKPAVLLAVQDQRRKFVLSADGDESPYMVESFEAAAEPMAMSIVIPSAVMLKKAGLIFEEVHAASPELMGTTAKDIGGDMPLLGSIVWSDADLGWIAHWRLYVGGRTYGWSIRGVSFDEAFRNAVRGAAQVLSGNGEPD
jgi:hypothetical protein